MDSNVSCPPIKRQRDEENNGNGENDSSKPIENPITRDGEQLLQYAKQSSTAYRSAFDSSHKVTRLGGKFHVLLAVTGSVAAIKIGELIQELYRQSPPNKVVIKIIATPSALNFFNPEELSEIVYDDRDEWNMWKKRGDPVLHIELRKWADSLLVAPLSANTLAKVANGLCDNLLTSVIRAWDQKKPLYFAPAMNTAMWDNPLTYQHLKILKELLLYREIPPIEKELICGDKGYGAMASLQMIASIIAADIKNKFAIYSYSASES